ncbi:hypothetical protein D6C83_05295 [Aureobasidium pullulans]|uniref:Uncharacterized protein n=1 Tax=Aureobasidium pullulans TaxID=5580 RepID=A0A4T0CFL8_AURPU|nr:hypothetical protein D6C83_05295 [Aureobasidium pullulans]
MLPKSIEVCTRCSSAKTGLLTGLDRLQALCLHNTTEQLQSRSAEAEAPSTSVFVASPLPTVFYNCHFAGSLCNDVELTQHGAHAGTIDMELVYDKDSDRRDSRRGKICPKTWNKKHTCPEVDQPDVWVRDSTRNADGNRLRPNKISNKLQYNMGMNGRKRNYLIEDYSGTPSGLMYTCDEFPFASTIQGGTGLAGDPNAGLTYGATTYCAPQGSRCAKDVRWQDDWLASHGLLSQWKALTPGSAAKSNWMAAKNMYYPVSDQNMQAGALSELARHFSKLKGDLFLFKLKTFSDPNEPRFAYMELEEDDDEEDDEDGDVDMSNTRRDLDMQSAFQIQHAANTSQEYRDLDSESKSRLPTGGDSYAPTSGFISLTRPDISARSLRLAPTEASQLIFPNNATVTTLPSTSTIIDATERLASFDPIRSDPLSASLTRPALFSNSSTVSSHISLSYSSISNTISDNSTTYQRTVSTSGSLLYSGSFTTSKPWSSRSSSFGMSNLTQVTSLQPSSSNQTSRVASNVGASRIITLSSANQTSSTLASSTLLLGNNGKTTSSTQSSITNSLSSRNTTSSSTEATGVAAANTSASVTTTSIVELGIASMTPVSSKNSSISDISLSSRRMSQTLGLNSTASGIIKISKSSGSGTSATGSRSSTITSSMFSTKSDASDSTASSNSPSSVFSNFATPSSLHSGPSASASLRSTDTSNISTITVPHIWTMSSPVVTCSPPCIIMLPPFPLTDSTTIIPDPVTTKDQTITFPPITTDMVSFSWVTINNPGDKVTPIPVIDPPKPITSPDEKPPATVIPKFTVRLPILPPIMLATPSLASKPSSTPVPPSPPANAEDEADEDEGEEEEDEDEEEDCDVPGWDPSDFPMPVPDGEHFGTETSATDSADTSSAATTSSVAPSSTIAASSAPAPTSERQSELTSNTPPPPSTTSESPPSPTSSTSEPPQPPPPPPPSSTQEAPPPPPLPSAHPPCKTWRDCDCDSALTISCSGPAGGQ